MIFTILSGYSLATAFLRKRFSSPPRYACFREEHPSGWMWTSELTEAESFSTREQAVRHMEGDMAGLVDGNPDVVPVAVELKVA